MYSNLKEEAKKEQQLMKEWMVCYQNYNNTVVKLFTWHTQEDRHFNMYANSECACAIAL